MQCFNDAVFYCLVKNDHSIIETLQKKIGQLSNDKCSNNKLWAITEHLVQCSCHCISPSVSSYTPRVAIMKGSQSFEQLFYPHSQATPRCEVKFQSGLELLLMSVPTLYLWLEMKRNKLVSSALMGTLVQLSHRPHPKLINLCTIMSSKGSLICVTQLIYTISD